MGGFYQYDTRGASASDQIMTLERLLEKAESEASELARLLHVLVAEKDALRRELDENEGVINVWRRRAERAEAENAENAENIALASRLADKFVAARAENEKMQNLLKRWIIRYPDNDKERAQLVTDTRNALRGGW